MKRQIFSLVVVFSFLTFIACKKEKITKQIVSNSIPQETEIAISISDIDLKNKLLSLANDSTHIYFKNKDSLLEFYKLRAYKSAWTSKENRKQLSLALSNSNLEGLSPKDYEADSIKQIISTARLEHFNIDSELQLTNALLNYSYHLANGKLNPSDLYDDWVLQPNVFNYNNELNKALNSSDIANHLNSYKPKHAIYNKLKKSLAKTLDSTSRDSSYRIIPFGDKIRPNNDDDRIIRIRKRLNELGYLNDTLVNASTKNDTILQSRIKQFQKDRKLKTDGIIGNSTIKALNFNDIDKALAIKANLERWRWYPRNFTDEYILVNIPDYKLEHITKKDTVHHNIIVGRTDRKTPIFESTIKYLELNPKWYIPPTIKNNDIIPSARKNPDYIRKKRITVFNTEGQVMNPDSVDWNNSITRKYKYVQSPGSSNSLGLVKIIFPNSFSVFLHDTNTRSLFKKNYRARSSGCVRIEKPFDLTERLLSGQKKWPRDSIDSYITRGKTQRIYMQKDVKVYFLYWSVTFDHDDNPVFFNDVYKVDADLAEKLN